MGFDLCFRRYKIARRRLETERNVARAVADRVDVGAIGGLPEQEMAARFVKYVPGSC